MSIRRGIHSNLISRNVDAPISWSYADATEREAATDFVPVDVGRFAWQLDDDTIWMLTDDDPATWVQVGGSSGESVYKDTRTNILALESPSDGMLAFATDTGEFAFYSEVAGWSFVGKMEGQGYTNGALMNWYDPPLGGDPGRWEQLAMTPIAGDLMKFSGINSRWEAVDSASAIDAKVFAYKDINIYVDPVVGDDDNSGLVSILPLQTIGKAFSLVEAKNVLRTTINLAAGVYTENGLTFGGWFGGRYGLFLTGDTRDTVGCGFAHGVATPQSGSNRGTGTISLAGGGGGGGAVTLTVTASTTNPDFEAAGIVAGDKVSTWNGTTLTEWTVASVAANVITTTSTGAAPTINVNGCVVVVHPNVKIISNATVGITATCMIDGIHFQTSSGNAVTPVGMDEFYAVRCLFDGMTASANGLRCLQGVGLTRLGLRTTTDPAVNITAPNTLVGTVGAYVYDNAYLRTQACTFIGSSQGAYAIANAYLNCETGVNIIAKTGGTGVLASYRGYAMCPGMNARNFATTPFNPSTSNTFGADLGAIYFT